MSGNWLGLVELLLVLLAVLGWAFYELYALRAKPPAEAITADEKDGATAKSAPPPRHPERQ